MMKPSVLLTLVAATLGVAGLAAAAPRALILTADAPAVQSGVPGADLLQIDSDDDDDDGGWSLFGRRHHRGHDDDDDHCEGDDDDDGEGRCGGRGQGNAAPAGATPPPRNGLFGNGKAPTATTN